MNKSHTQIAKELNISRQAVDSWFKGRAKPCKKHIAALAIVLDVPQEEVLDRLKR